MLVCLGYLPVPNALEFAGWAEQTLGISRYRAGSQTFTPIGDANGLLIAVTLGREWYPQTGVLAAAHFTRLELVGEACGGQYLDLPYEIVQS
jgi:hypothetical protein